MNATLYLMRHGRTVEEAPWRFLGQRDLPLSPVGRIQCASWREELSGVDFAGAWCSDLGRCRESAALILEGRDLMPTPLAGLREIALGEWEGLSKEEVRQRFPGQYEARGADLANFRPPGGESFADLSERAWTALMKILGSGERHDADNLLVVAHAGVNRAILCRLLDMPLDRLFRLDQDPACLNIVKFVRGEPRLAQLNRQPPLAALRATHP